MTATDLTAGFPRRTFFVADVCSFFLLFVLLSASCGHAQNKLIMLNDTTGNPLMCDPAEGVCAIPGTAKETKGTSPGSNNKIKVIYFTDPICSSCWGIEPQLRKLKLEFGHALEIEYRMGGLLPDWSYNSGGISKPSDVAHHWDEVSRYYDMPIDGDLWLEDPLHSSFPPSIAFKAAELQSAGKGQVFLRIIREMVFLQKKNIAKWENIAEAAIAAGLDTALLKNDMAGKARQLFEADLQLARDMGVRGFPTLFISGPNNNNQVIYGSKTYAAFEEALHQVRSDLKPAVYPSGAEELFEEFSSMTAREYSELSGTKRDQAEAALDQLVKKGILKKYSTRNGAIWSVVR